MQGFQLFLTLCFAASLFQFDTVWAVPLPLWLLSDTNTAVVEPLNQAVRVVAGDHLTIRNTIAYAVTRL